MSVTTPPPGFSNWGRASYHDTEDYSGINWMDGKNIWRKIIGLGNLPNADRKFVPHGITNIEYMINIWGTATRNDGVVHIPLPFVHENLSRTVRLLVNGPDIVVDTAGFDRSDYEAFAVLAYTKT